MGRRFSFHPYQRTFAKPLRTARGAWTVREGFILRVEDELGVGYGEVAPIPEFGSETVEAVRAYLERLVAAPDLADDTVALSALPCCAFGVSAALAGGQVATMRDYTVAALLPAGRAALQLIGSKLVLGYTTFKWKIGVEPIEVEQAIFRELVALLPTGARLRLDANGGLSVEVLGSWLRVLQDFSEQVEYLEQPLPVGQEVLMAKVAASFGVAIALDESLNGADGAQWLGQWNGPLVVKPALMGDCDALVERLRPVAERVILSSVFETAIGLGNALRIADQLPEHNRAIGFDTLDAFADSLTHLNPAPVICADERAQFAPDTIWKQLPYLT
jgi:O-succinylbenzoate synthase